MSKKPPTDTALALNEGSKPKNGKEYAIMLRDPADIKAIMEANFGAAGSIGPRDLEKIKVPAGGQTAWAITTLDEGETVVKELEGIILHWQDVRAYYSRPLEEGGGNQAPDCYSEDGKTGQGDPGGPCHTCPLSQWGSDPKGGKGKACKEKRILFLLRPENMIPDVVFIPPTSLKSVRAYFLRLASQGMPFHAVKTRLGLVKAQSAANIAYAQVTAGMVARLEPGEAERVRSMVSALRPSMEKFKPDPEDLKDAGMGDAHEG